MANLGAEFAGVKMRNPIGIAPHGCPNAIGRSSARRLADFLMRYVDRGAGYVYTPITCGERESPLQKKHMGRFLKIESEGFAPREGMLTIADVNVGMHRLDATVETIRLLKERVPEDVPIFANPVGEGDNIESWVAVSKALEDAGADLIELNFSCPLPAMADEDYRKKRTDIPPSIMAEMERVGLSPFLGDTPEAIKPIVEAVVKAVKIPVGVKPSPEAGFPRIVAIMKVIAEAGAKFITNINCPISLAPPDIYNEGKPLWPKFDINPFAAAIGPWNRYQLYKAVAAGSVFVPEVDHAAVGGIVHPRHMLELMMIGAKHIGLSSALYWGGIRVIPQFISFLEKYMDDQGYEKIDDFLGIAKKYIVPINEMTDWKVDKVVARIDRSKCNECGICIENFCFATLKDTQGRPIINEDECGACALCVAICPQGAVSLADR